MEETQYPCNGFNNAHEIIKEAINTNKPICDILGRGLPDTYTQDQLITAYLNRKCSEDYLAERLKIDRLAVRRLIQEKAEYDEWMDEVMEGL